VDAVLLKKLEVRRFGEASKKKPRGKKIPAGMSYTVEEEKENSDMGEESEVDTESEVEVESEVESEVECEVESSEEETEELPDIEPTPGPSNNKKKGPPTHSQLLYQPGSHVVAVYEGEWFLCEVCLDQQGVSKGYTRLSYTTIKGNNNFAWGEKADLHITLNEDILVTNVSPKPVNSRGNLGLDRIDLTCVLARMVMVFFLPFIFLQFCHLNLFNCSKYFSFLSYFLAILQFKFV
jgi:hypothetical protein